MMSPPPPRQSLGHPLLWLPPSRLAEAIHLLPCRMPPMLGMDAPLLAQALAEAGHRGLDPLTQIPNFYPPFRVQPGSWDAHAVAAALTGPPAPKLAVLDPSVLARRLDGAVARLLRGQPIDPLAFLGKDAGIPGQGARLRLDHALMTAPAQGRMAWWRESYWRRSILSCLLHRGLGPGNGPWGIHLQGQEAQGVVPGWPKGRSAVLCVSPSGATRWGACAPGDERDLAAGAVLWPPAAEERSHFRPDPDHEIALLSALVGERDVALRAARVEAPPLQIEDIDWD